MAELRASDAPTKDEELPEPLTFTLQVVSPSVGVASPLIFSHLPANTTIKQLKARIRGVLPSKPTDDSQRLIHRGRMLGRDLDSMLDVFGQEALGSPDSQTLHLVLRPTTSDGPSTTSSVSAPTTGPLPNHPAPSVLQPQPRPQSTPANPVLGMPIQQPLPAFPQLQPLPPFPQLQPLPPFPQLHLPPVPPHLQQHQALHQGEHTHQLMAQRLHQLARESQRLQQEMGSIEQRYRAMQANQGPINGQQGPGGQATPTGQPGSPFPLPRSVQPQVPFPPSVQALIAQQQRDRAVEGRHAAQEGVGPMGMGLGLGRSTTPGRSSPGPRPDHTTTYTRERIGPNGDRWQVTVNETTTIFPTIRTGSPLHHQNTHHSGNQALDVAQVLQNADRSVNNRIPEIMAQMQARARAAQAMEQNAPASPVDSQVPNPAPTSAPSLVAGAATTPRSMSGSPTAADAMNLHSNTPRPNSSVNISTDNVAGPLRNSDDPTVYILSSPRGPRALLVTNSETFYTPRHSRSRRTGSPGHGLGQFQGQGLTRGMIQLPEFRNRHAGRGARRNVRQEQGNPIAPVAPPQANPEARALAAQVGPMLWLIARLVGFVWFFTSGNSSWTRWLMVSGTAFIVFLINTGIFNGIANQVWAPVRQHLEALIPLAGPDAALIPAANAAAIPQAAVVPPEGNLAPVQGGRRGELDPAQVAARLIEQHRQRNASWLMTRIRRAEHSLLLFLASLIPGVGERHIAAREAEANAAAAAEAERQRQQEADNAANNPEGNENPDETAQNEGSPSAVQGVSENRASQSTGAEEGQAENNVAAEAPLIEI